MYLFGKRTEDLDSIKTTQISPTIRKVLDIRPTFR